MDRTPVLHCHGLGRRFGTQRVLEGVQLEVHPGETVALMGPNGSGKSTLLSLIAGILHASSGEVQVAGHPTGSLPARRSLGYAPQDPPLYAELTPVEHLLWWGTLQGTPVGHRDAVERLTESGLGHSVSKPAGELSRGQRQRLSLMMAMLPAPPLLLMDEPYTALDEAGEAWLDERLRRHEGAVVLALHDPQKAQSLADRIVRIQDHRIVEDPRA